MGPHGPATGTQVSTHGSLLPEDGGLAVCKENVATTLGWNRSSKEDLCCCIGIFAILLLLHFVQLCLWLLLQRCSVDSGQPSQLFKLIEFIANSQS